MSDYYHRMKMQGEPCKKCDTGTIQGNERVVSCTNPDCNFMY